MASYLGSSFWDCVMEYGIQLRREGLETRGVAGRVSRKAFFYIIILIVLNIFYLQSENSRKLYQILLLIILIDIT